MASDNPEPTIERPDGMDETTVDSENAGPSENTALKDVPMPDETDVSDETAVPSETIVPDNENSPNKTTASDDVPMPDETAVPSENVSLNGKAMADENASPDEDAPPEEQVVPNGETVRDGEVVPDGETIPGGGNVSDGGIGPDVNTVPAGPAVPDADTVPDEVTVPEADIVQDEDTVPEEGIVPNEDIVPDEDTGPDEGIVPEASAISATDDVSASQGENDKGPEETPGGNTSQDPDSPTPPNNGSSDNDPLSKDYFQTLRDNNAKKPRLTQAERERQLANQHLLAQQAHVIQNAQSTPRNATQPSKMPSENPPPTGSESRSPKARREPTPPGNARQSSTRDTPGEDENEDPEYAEIEKIFKAKKATGKVGLIDSIKFVKAKRHKTDLLQKRDADIQAQMDAAAEEFNAAGNESIFLEGEDDDGTAGIGESSRDGARAGGGQGYRSRKAPPLQRLPPLPRLAPSDMSESLNAGLDEIKARHEKKNKKVGGKKGASTGGFKKTSAAPGAKRKRETKPGEGVNAPPPKKHKGRPRKAQRAAVPAEGHISSLADLGDGDVVEDGSAAANAGGTEPTLDDRNKSRALMSLLARVPLEDQRYAKLDKKALDDAAKHLTWRRAQVNVQGNGWTIKGMTAVLKNFQLLGLARLRTLERRVGEPKGGIIADAMGFGKTISMLANIVDGAAHPGEPNRATLIVVPTAIRGQWMSEIKKHTQEGMLPNVMIHDGTMLHRDPLRVMQNADIVVTTYNMLRASYPKNEPPKDLTDAEQIAWFKEEFERRRGLLHRVSWLRVVLDECNAIKNHKSQTAIAACGLIAKHRWLISGTIVTNQIAEFYSYFRFLKVPCAGTLELFTQNFLKDEKVQNRLYEILKTIMIRRTLKERLFGAPLVHLPTIETHTIQIDFSKTERKIYDIIFKRCEKSVRDCAQKPGATPREIFCHAFLRLLLLRQLTGHFRCCSPTLYKFLEEKDMAKLFDLCDKQDDEESSDMVGKLRRILSDVESDMGRESTESSRSGSVETENDQETRNKPTAPELLRIVEQGQAAGAIEDMLCAECRQPPGDGAWDTDCGHVLCDECLDGLQISAAINKLEGAPCPICTIVFHPTQRKSRSGGSKKKKKQANGTDKDAPFFHSSKTRAIKAAISNWIADNPNVKSVIFTQFLAMSELIARMCKNEHWGHLLYNGNMNLKAREKAIEDFREKSDKNILIASLKAGGVGLNLTQATRVLMVDLYWNYAQEEQAFCRVYRIGQTQHTVIHRFAIRNTVDTELLKMQDRKNREINQVLTGKTTLIRLPELMALFGISEDGRIRRDAEDPSFLVPNDNVNELVEELPDEVLEE